MMFIPDPKKNRNKTNFNILANHPRGDGEVNDSSPGTRKPLRTQIASKQSPVSMNLLHCASGSVVPPEEDIGGMIIKNEIKTQSNTLFTGSEN